MTIKTLTTKNGTQVKLEPRYLDEDFIEEVKEHFMKKHKVGSSFPFNSYFFARAVEEFIIDTNTPPVYE